jgi:hypothetical protein
MTGDIGEDDPDVSGEIIDLYVKKEMKWQRTTPDINKPDIYIQSLNRAQSQFKFVHGTLLSSARLIESKCH